MKYLSFTFLVLLGFNAFVWYHVATGGQENLDIYFLDVGQGDSSLVVLPGDVKVLIDGGPDKGVLFELEKVLPGTQRYIDLVVVTHPQLDHFGGLYDVIERYRVGALIAPAREGESEAWDGFVVLLKEENIPLVLVEAGDSIRYRGSSFAVLSPDADFLRHEEVNEASVVLGLNSEGAKALFTGDIGFETENHLADTYNIDTDILKVAHHGSKFSTGLKFLAEATPNISVIQVGRNRFGHPTPAALSRLRQVGSSVYRTDEGGTVHIEADDGIINVSLKVDGK